MKWTSFLFILILSQEVFAMAKYPPKIEQKASELKINNVPCKEKVLPLKIDYMKSGTAITITLTAESNIKDFVVSGVRGIDGLSVKSAEIPLKSDISPADIKSIVLEVQESGGLSYLILDLSGNVKGLTKKQSLALPIGEQTAVQKILAEKNIQNLESSQRPGGKQKVHMMRFDD